MPSAFNASRSNACGVQGFVFKCLRRSMSGLRVEPLNAQSALNP